MSSAQPEVRRRRRRSRTRSAPRSPRSARHRSRRRSRSASSATSRRRAAGLPRRARHPDRLRARRRDGARRRRTPPRRSSCASSAPARATAKDRIVLPEPLADPLQDIRVNRATAEAYVVRAGEYIQIIDVAGRQCSDFQCFSARKLDKGTERPLDATTTRSLTGLGYPAPGLPAKAFDQDMEPLVEIVQRHGRPPRCLRARLLRKILRGHGLSGPRQLHRQFQRRARSLRHRGPQGLDGAQLLLQHRHRRQ